MMRIAEILFCNNEPTEEDRATPQLHSPPAPVSDDLTNLGNAFTRRGLVKHFWLERIGRSAVWTSAARYGN